LRPDFDAQTTSYFLRHLNPASCSIATTGVPNHVPTSYFVSEANFHFCTSTWTRLRQVGSAGTASVPILKETGFFAFSETLARCSPPSDSDFAVESIIRMVMRMSDGSARESKLIVDSEIQEWMEFLSQKAVEDGQEILDCRLQVHRLTRRKGNQVEEMRVD